MSAERLSGVQVSYIEQLNPPDLMRLFFQLGREAGLAEAAARRDGQEAAVLEERKRVAEAQRSWDDFMERAKKQTRTTTVHVEPVNVDLTALSKVRWTPRPSPDPQPSKEPEMAAAVETKPAKSPTRLKPGSALVGDHTTVTYTIEPEKHRPARIGDVIMVTAAGRQVEIRLTPSGRKAKVYVDGMEIQGV